jgi:hypothetical protein
VRPNKGEMMDGKVHVRVRCATRECKEGGVKLVAVGKENGVLMVPRMVCVGCGEEVKVLNKGLRKMIEGKGEGG